MSPILQTELHERAAAYGSQWSPSTPDDAEVTLLHTEVARKRRGRAGLAAASGLCVALLAVAAYAATDAPTPANPVAAVTKTSPLGILGTLGPNDAVLTLSEDAVAGSTDEIVIVHTNATAVERVSAAEIKEALGSAADGWASITLVGTQPELSRAVFALDDPSTPAARRMAIYDWLSGNTQVVDPCHSPARETDTFFWCPMGLGPETTVPTPAEGSAPEDNFFRCVSAGHRLRMIVAHTCKHFDGTNYLYLMDLDTTVSSTRALGPGEVEAPIVTDGSIFANLVTTEGDPVLITAEGFQVDVGGAPVHGLGLVDGQILVVTSSDRFGPESTYGHVLGLWEPSTDEFRVLNQVPIGQDTEVGFVGLVR